jgi:hypothetical protein
MVDREGVTQCVTPSHSVWFIVSSRPRLQIKSLHYLGIADTSLTGSIPQVVCSKCRILTRMSARMPYLARFVYILIASALLGTIRVYIDCECRCAIERAATMTGSMLIVPMSGARMIVVAAHDAMARLYHWTSLRGIPTQTHLIKRNVQSPTWHDCEFPRFISRRPSSLKQSVCELLHSNIISYFMGA